MYLLHFKFLPSGKWYWEYFLDGTTSGGVVGIADGSAMNGTALADWTKIYGYSSNGNKYENASSSIMVLLSLLEI